MVRQPFLQAVTLLFATILLVEFTPRLATAQPHSATRLQNSPPGGICILADATGSVDAPAGSSGTRRELYLDAIRTIIRTAERAKVVLTIGRLCGVAEQIWGPAPVTRRDFGALIPVLQEALGTCSSTASGVPVRDRPRGTDVVAGLKWLEQQPKTTYLVFVTDAIHEPPRLNGRPAFSELYRALDRLAPDVRARLWMIGVDESLRNDITSRISNTWGTADLGRGVDELKRELINGRR